MPLSDAMNAPVAMLEISYISPFTTPPISLLMENLLPEMEAQAPASEPLN